MPRFLGSALDIPAASTANQAARKSYVDSGDAALGVRVAALEAGGGNSTGQTLATRTATGSITAAAGDFVLADATSGSFIVTLASHPPVNTAIAVKKTDTTSNLVTVVGSDSASIDGDINLTLLQAQSGAVLVYDGTNWRVESTVIFDPGESNFTYRGDWATGVDYGVNDVVYYSGNSYVARLGSNSQAPTMDASDANWGLLALHGTNGTGGAGNGYQHVQSTPGAVWQISHGLGYDPAGITVIDDVGDTIDEAVVQYLNPGQTLRLSFDISISGTAYLS